MQNTSQNSPNQNPQNAQNAQNPNTPNQNAPRQASPNQANPTQPGQTPGQSQDAMTQRDESGLPGGGVGRKDVVGHTGVYPLSADEGASGNAKVEPEEAFGQGERGAAGYQDSGGSAIIPPDDLGKGDKEVI